MIGTFLRDANPFERPLPGGDPKDARGTQKLVRPLRLGGQGAVWLVDDMYRKLILRLAGV